MLCIDSWPLPLNGLICDWLLYQEALSLLWALHHPWLIWNLCCWIGRLTVVLCWCEGWGQGEANSIVKVHVGGVEKTDYALQKSWSELQVLKFTMYFPLNHLIISFSICDHDAGLIVLLLAWRLLLSLGTYISSKHIGNTCNTNKIMRVSTCIYNQCHDEGLSTTAKLMAYVNERPSSRARLCGCLRWRVWKWWCVFNQCDAFWKREPVVIQATCMD